MVSNRCCDPRPRLAALFWRFDLHGARRAAYVLTVYPSEWDGREAAGCSPSEAKAVGIERAWIAAVNRCATQKL